MEKNNKKRTVIVLKKVNVDYLKENSILAHSCSKAHAG